MKQHFELGIHSFWDFLNWKCFRKCQLKSFLLQQQSIGYIHSHWARYLLYHIMCYFRNQTVASRRVSVSGVSHIFLNRNLWIFCLVWLAKTNLFIWLLNYIRMLTICWMWSSSSGWEVYNMCTMVFDCIYLDLELEIRGWKEMFSRVSVDEYENVLFHIHNKLLFTK